VLTTITLTEAERAWLQLVSKRTGKGPQELLQEALDLLADRYSASDRLGSLRQARGIWKDRDDLPNLMELRAEFDRRETGMISSMGDPVRIAADPGPTTNGRPHD
jgi:hypothetical protein